MPDAHPSSANPRMAAYALAVLLPVLVVATWWAALQAEDTAAPQSELAVSIDEELAQVHPRILLVGSSLLGRGVDEGALARLLGLPATQVHKLWRTAVVPPHWYLMLKKHVSSGQLEPDVVVVCSTNARFHQTWVETDWRETMLADLGGADDSVIQYRVYGREELASPWGRIKARRSHLREQLLDRVKYATVGLLFAPPDAPDRLAAGKNIADESLDRLLMSEEAKDMSLYDRVIPIVEDVLDQEPVAAAEVSAEDSFVADLVDLAQANDARIVFVNLPVSSAATERQEGSATLRRDLLRYLNERGAGYVDLGDVPVTDRDFRDTTHLNEHGRELVTKALAEGLKALGALEQGPLAPARLGLDLLDAPAITRSGTPPALPAPTFASGAKTCRWNADLRELRQLSDGAMLVSGLAPASPVLVLDRGQPLRPFAAGRELAAGCAGASSFTGARLQVSARDEAATAEGFSLALSTDLPVTSPKGSAWWLYPGTTLRFDFTETSVISGETIQIEAAVLPMGARNAAPPTLRVAGGEPQPFARRRAVLRARQELVVPAGPWSIEVALPDDGAWAVLGGLDLVLGDDRGHVVGEGVDGVGVTRVSALAWQGEGAVHTVATSPPTIDDVVVQPATGKQPVGRIAVPQLEFLSAERILRAALVRFSPVRVAEDGVPLPGEPVTCRSVRNTGTGRYCHINDTILVSSPDGSAPATSGKKYTVFFDPDRRDAGGYWVYPGDRMVVPLASSIRRIVGFLVDDIQLEAYGFAPPDDVSGGLFVRVVDDGKLLTEVHLDRAALARGHATIDLGEGIPVHSDVMAIELASADATTFWWVRAVDLVRDRVDPGDGTADIPPADDAED